MHGMGGGHGGHGGHGMGGGGGMGFRRRLQEDRKTAKISEIKRKDLKFIVPHVMRQKWRVLLAITLTLSISATSIVAPWLSKLLVDDYIVRADLMGIVLVSMLMLGMHATNWSLHYIQSRNTVGLAQRVIKDVRRDVYKKILALSLRFNTERKKGELLSLVTNNVAVLSDAFSSGIVNVFTDIVTLVGVLVAMSMLDVELTAISLVIAPLILLTVLALRGRIRAAFIEVRRKIAMLTARVEENIAGIRVVKAMRVEGRKNQDFMDMSMVNFRTSMKATLLFAAMFALVSINSFLVFALIIGFGGTRYIEGSVTLGDLVAFFQYIIMFLRPIQDLVSTYNTFQEAAAALLHIAEYMRYPIDVPEPAPAERVSLPTPVRGRIELNDVTFRYGSEPLFEGLNLAIEPGEKLGVVGETGAGKTTLINLITRLYDVIGGSVSIDGVDVRKLPSQEFRRQFAVVSQNVVIFSDSAKNNIRFGRPGASDEEVVEAARLANAHAFIEQMPEGYNTMLSERGYNLSGGQKQLIAYARLLLARPAIAILDEATSNIDSYTEDLIQKNMGAVLKQCTTIVIAHRFATLHAVDRLVLMDKGRIADTGTHRELYGRNAYYRQLYDTQYARM
ncbi:MAG: ABC transporter ATP-binding protein [Candidatus Lokiarchaeota archaeon]|nr:ABC transporter ATP-binding protein [Candidatus Lokiarchaeota archaeon]